MADSGMESSGDLSLSDFFKPNRGWFLIAAGVLAVWALYKIDAPLWLGLVTLSLLLGCAAFWPWIERTPKRRACFGMFAFVYLLFGGVVIFRHSNARAIQDKADNSNLIPAPSIIDSPTPEIQVYEPFKPAYRHNKKLGSPDEEQQAVREAYHAEHENAIAIWLEGTDQGGGGKIYLLDTRKSNNEYRWTEMLDPGLGNEESYWRDDGDVVKRFREKFGAKKGTLSPGTSPPYGPIAKGWYLHPDDWSWIGGRTPYHCDYRDYAVHIQKFKNGLIIGPVRRGKDDPSGRVLILVYADKETYGTWKEEDVIKYTQPTCASPPTK
jgi:hypothetical protein